MEIINLLSRLIDAGAIDLFADPGHLLHARGPRGILPLQDLVDDAQETSLQFLQWLTSEGNLPEAKKAEILQRGHTDYAIALPGGIRLRVHAFRYQEDVAFVVRLIPLTPESLEVLGLDPIIQERVVTARRGLFLVTGPTGVGKSTTLAALLQYIADRYPYHILTFEDPIEYVIRSKLGLVHQRELYRDFFSFARDLNSGLRSALRASPDVVMIGEMRDLETVDWALALAEAGFLVLATYHTRGAQETIDRLVSFYPQSEQALARTRLANVLIGTLSQILLPTERTGGETNYQLRAVAYEYMFKTPAIARMIREGDTKLIPQELGKSGVGQPLEHRLATLYKSGYISRETAQAHANNLDTLSRLLGVGALQ